MVMKATVYLDTTVPSYYVDERKEVWLHIQRTRRWWNFERRHYEVYISEFVIVELEEGKYPGRAKALSLVRRLPRLAVDSDIKEIASVYLAHRLMPSTDVRDALHLAIASRYKIDYLLTWNCAHLANAHKRRHIRVINTRLGIWTPEIVTPLELVPPREDTE